MEDPDYGDGHRAFLQAFMARGTMTFRQARPILAAIETTTRGSEVPPTSITPELFETYITLLNDALSPLDLQIRSMIPQSALSTSTSHRLYALVNTTSDAPTQLATLHTPDELAFFKRLLDALFETRNGPERELLALKSTDALNLARADPSSTALPSTQSAATQTAAAQSSLTQKDAEKALQSFLDEGWLEKSERGYYTLSCRALLELREYLKATYDGEGPLAEGELPRIKECWACKEMLTVGQRCADLACACRLHDRCVETFFRTGPGREKKCPVCRREWTQDCFVGERAATGAGGGTGTGAGNGNGTGTGRERRSGAGGRRSTAGVGRG